MNAKVIGKYRWTICALLFFATTVNYLDRQVLSLLKPMLEEKFGWSNSDYADIAAIFQFTYAISMLFAGRIIDKLGTKKGLDVYKRQDLNHATLSEVKDLVKGDGSGRVQR